jgi:hypothetical protein
MATSIVSEPNSRIGIVKGLCLALLVLSIGFGLTPSVSADDVTAPLPEDEAIPLPQEEVEPPPQEEAAPPPEAPPLPLHGIEGMGGVFSTYSAYLVNSGGDDEIFGLPSVGFAYVHLGHGRHLLAPTITETLFGRLELGYSLNHFDLGDLPSDIRAVTGINIDQSVNLHNFNARLLLLKEGAFDQSWLPAITFGAHYKWNTDIDDIDRDLNGTLRTIGIKSDDGVDFTFYASKLITFLPRPVLINLGVRSTKAAHLGLFGFTGTRKWLFEGNFVLLITDRILLAAEYRQKPSQYNQIPGLVKGENDWWTICPAFVVNEHLTISGGYGHFGDVLNHSANGSWGIKAKWEF